MHFLLNTFFVLFFILLSCALFTAHVARKVNQAFRPGEWMDVDGERLQYRSFGRARPSCWCTEWAASRATSTTCP